MQITPHFSREELVRSSIALRRGIPNDPNDAQERNLETLAHAILEPTRAVLGVPMSISSGFRSLSVNQLVGGADHSAHLEGRAADFEPVGLSLHDAFAKIRASDVPFDQVIIECNAWIHIAVARAGETPRRQALVASGGPGHWRYEVAP